MKILLVSMVIISLTGCAVGGRVCTVVAGHSVCGEVSTGTESVRGELNGAGKNSRY